MTNKPAIETLMRYPHALAIPPETSLENAWITMQAHQIHHLLVVNDAGQFQGIVTDRTLFEKAWDKNGQIYASNTPVSHVMRTGIPPLSPDTQIGEALSCMMEMQVSALPVRVSPTEWGIVTERDFLRYLRQSSTELSEGRKLLQATDQTLANPLVQSIMKLLSDMGV